MDLDKTSDNVRKCLRTSEILKPYKIVRSIIGFMETQFIGLSDDVFDKKKLYNLIWGQWVMDIIEVSLFKIDEIGIC